MSIGQFREELANSGIEPRVLSTCIAITDLISDLKPGDGKHLGLPYFFERLSPEKHRPFVLPALSILCTRKGAILEMHGYLDDAELGQLHLSSEEFHDMLTSGRLAHPESGELVENPMQHVRIFYSLRTEAAHGN